MNNVIMVCVAGLLMVVSCAEAGRKNHLDKRQDVVKHPLKLHNAWLVDVEDNAEEGLCEDFKEHFLLGTICHEKVLKDAAGDPADRDLFRLCLKYSEAVERVTLRGGLGPQL